MVFFPSFPLVSFIASTSFSTGDTLACNHGLCISPSTPILCGLFDCYAITCCRSCPQHLPLLQLQPSRCPTLGINKATSSKQPRYARSSMNATTSTPSILSTLIRTIYTPPSSPSSALAASAFFDAPIFANRDCGFAL